MNRKLWLCGLTLMTTYLGGTSILADGKWIVLFDGTSKDAWRGYQRKDFPDKGWVVDQGAFKTVVGGEHVDLVTKEKFSNFELELEWKVSPGGNGGIFYRASEEDKEIWHSAPEIQVLDDDRHRDGKNPKTSAGSLYALIAPVGKTLRPVGEFNQFRLLLRGNYGEHWLNGVKVVEYDLASPTLKELISQSKFKDMPRFAMLSEGYLVSNTTARKCGIGTFESESCLRNRPSLSRIRHQSDGVRLPAGFPLSLIRRPFI